MTDKKTGFWIAYAVIAAASLALAWLLVPQAIPIVNLEIKMPRAAAIANAQALAEQYRLAPEDARTAAVFNQDSTTQNYIELEGGGKEAFARLVASKTYAPYWWEVRLFKLGVIEEATVRFRPDGGRYGFFRKVGEAYVHDEAAKALDADTALALAKTRAHEDWSVDFTPYRLLDQSQQTQTTGRVDHRFVFEREGKIGEATIRLALTVSGDELTEVHPFVHVPESFTRRFGEMRSANNAIAYVATITAGILYGLCGVILGSLFLLRRHYLLARPSFVAGLVVAGLLAISVLGNTSISWFEFPTTQQESNFWTRQIGAALLIFVVGGMTLGVVFMAAEGLTRMAFPDHPQLWRVWSRAAAPTPQIAGRTFGGFLFVGLQLGFVAVFYALTNRYLGWWQPSEQFTDPNILASGIPAMGPIAMALQAGTMEECAFRGIPLALGALIGARYGRRGVGIAVAFVIQAVVFGSAHANYPGFPPYSRLVELIVPSLVWAAIFLRYGLVPTIIAHAIFDLTLMSIPLFLIDAPGAYAQRGIVIVAGLVPLIVIAVRRVQVGAFVPLAESLRNRAWQAPAPPVHAEEHAVVATVDRRALLLQRSLPILGLAGLAGWFAFTPLRADAPSLAIDRAAAIAVAESELRARGVVLGEEWKRMATTRSALDDPNQRQWHRFTWREAGPVAYRALVGNALAPPLWDVRFARFAGDVADRAEEWRVTIAGDGKVRQVLHRLPEARPGAMLSRDEAQALAEKTLRREIGSDAGALVPRGAEQVQRPARRDWVFAYGDPRVDVGKGGEARVQVAIAGDEIVSAGRSVFVPEAWQRAESEKDAQRQLLRILAAGLIAVSAVAALVYAVSAWNKRRCNRRALVWIAAGAFLLTLLTSANGWPSHMFGLNTTEPLANQILMIVLRLAAGAVLLALLSGLLAGVGVYYALRQAPVRLATSVPVWACGVLAALTTAGVAASLSSFVPPTAPTWPDVSAMASWWPVFNATVAGIAVVPAAAVTLFLLSVFDRVTRGWSRHVALVAVYLVLLSTAVSVLSGLDAGQAALHGLVEGVTTFLFAWLLLRYDLRAVPPFVAAGLILEAVRRASLVATPPAWTMCLVTSLVAVALAAWCVRYLSRNASPAITEVAGESA